MRFKNLEEKPIRIISANGGFGRLQMVSESNTERCASEEDEPRREVDKRQCANKDYNAPNPPLANIVLFGLSLSGFPSRL